MKRLILSVFVSGIFLLPGNVHSQTNTFPDSGNVGIGTTNPLAKLHVNGGTEASIISGGLRVDRSALTFIRSQETAPFAYGAGYTLETEDQEWRISNSYQGAKDSFIIRNQTLGTNVIEILSQVDINLSTGINGNLDVTGNVGIGVSSPRTKLHVSRPVEQTSASITAYSSNLSTGDYVTTNIYRSMSGATYTNGSSGLISNYITYRSAHGGYLNYDNQGYGFYSQGEYPRMFMEVVSGGHGTIDNLPSDSPIKTGYLYQQIKGPSGSNVSAPIKATNLNSTWLWGIKSNGDAIFAEGKVGIGTTSPDEKLTVKGNIHAEEIIVDLNVPGPDYVFDAGYELASLAEIEAFINANKHLPEVPSAAQMEEEGIVLGQMNMLLLKKIEELTLYSIEQEKQIKKQEEVITELLTRVETLENKE